MENFSTFTQACVPYFSAVAQVSGGLLGLVFVALTFNPKALGLREHPALRNLAQQTFADFLMVLVVALIMLLPNTLPRQVGLILASIAALAGIRIVRSLFALRRDATGSWKRGLILQRYGLSLLGHIGLIAAGVLLAGNGATGSAMGSLLLMSPLALLVSGTRSAWLLVVGNAE